MNRASFREYCGKNIASIKSSNSIILQRKKRSYFFIPWNRKSKKLFQKTHTVLYDATLKHDSYVEKTAKYLSRSPETEEVLKRSVDIAITVVAIFFLAILMLMIAMLIKLDSRGPIFFTQERLGRFRVPFKCIKFRTMVHNAEQNTGPVWASKYDCRVTRIGHILRKSRLDELPQLLNVLRGDMSIVGPRPIRQFFADQLVVHEPHYDLRFAVKPGITGWAQVKYKYAASIDDQLTKYSYDIFYITNRSLLFDFMIMAETFLIVFGLRGL